MHEPTCARRDSDTGESCTTVIDCQSMISDLVVVSKDFVLMCDFFSLLFFLFLTSHEWLQQHNTRVIFLTFRLSHLIERLIIIVCCR